MAAECVNHSATKAGQKVKVTSHKNIAGMGPPFSDCVNKEAQLLPRDLHDTLYQLKYWPTVVRITQTDCVSARGTLSATIMIYWATCMVLYMHRCTSLNYCTVSMRCHGCQHTSIQPTFLDCNCDH